MRKIDKKSIVVWLLEDFQYFFIRIIFFGIIYYFFREYILVQKIIFLFSLYFTALFIRDLILDSLRYRNFRYLITEPNVYVHKGGLTIYHETIPIHRIQHVDIEQSVYARFFQLYSLTIYTAGLDHTIEYLSKEQAERWKTYIISLLVNMENKKDA